MCGRLEWPDPTEYMSPEEEREIEEANECDCDHGRVVVFYCQTGPCMCGMCPEVVE
jgi:hypothetical protein